MEDNAVKEFCDERVRIAIEGVTQRYESYLMKLIPCIERLEYIINSKDSLETRLRATNVKEDIKYVLYIADIITKED